MNAYVKVFTSVSRNRKFVKAGPAPSWLWLCGLLYCQEGHTDGFIPDDALPYLGVKNAKQLAAHLVKAGLWDVEDGGWRVHDYLDHNRSADAIEDIKARRGNGGKLGGRPPKKAVEKTLPETLKVSAPETIRETSPVYVSAAAADVVVEKREKYGDPPLDRWFNELHAAYPQKSVSRGHLTEQAFCAAVLSHGTPLATFTAMLYNLETQKRGAQWLAGKIPRLDRWLDGGLWEQQHDAPTLTDRNAGTVSAAAGIMAEVD